MSPTKVCARCGADKPLADFYRRPDGRPNSWCKACHNAKSREAERAKLKPPTP